MHLNYIAQIPKMRFQLGNTKFLESVIHDFLTVLPLFVIHPKNFLGAPWAPFFCFF